MNVKYVIIRHDNVHFYVTKPDVTKTESVDSRDFIAFCLSRLEGEKWFYILKDIPSNKLNK